MAVVEIEAGDMVEGALGTEENVAFKSFKVLEKALQFVACKL